MGVKSSHAVSPRFPVQRSSEQGESAPKARLRSVADGKQVNIPVPTCDAKGGRMVESGQAVGRACCCFAEGGQVNPVTDLQGNDTSEFIHEAIGSGPRKSP